ncbi:MAG TPA: hypothetical protein VHB98_16115 [Chloroflexota bacterium]|jgi:hypothetical protein|nr:hypothetical protein [Chloroflexota bacterium]
MSVTQMLKEIVPWILLALLFAVAVRLAGSISAGHPRGGATSEQLVSLHAAAGATVTGAAIFSYDSATGKTTITLTVMYLVAGSAPRAALHDGTCAAIGALVQVFPSARAGGHGDARLVARRDGSFVSRRWVVTVQAGPGLSSMPHGRVLACGALV